MQLLASGARFRFPAFLANRAKQTSYIKAVSTETMCKTPSKTLFYLQHSCARMEWCYVNDAGLGRDIRVIGLSSLCEQCDNCEQSILVQRKMLDCLESVS